MSFLTRALLPFLTILTVACIPPGPSSGTGKPKGPTLPPISVKIADLARAEEQIKNIQATFGLSIGIKLPLVGTSGQPTVSGLFLDRKTLYVVSQTAASAPKEDAGFLLLSVNTDNAAIGWVLPFDGKIVVPPLRDRQGDFDMLYVVSGDHLIGVEIAGQKGRLGKAAWKKWKHSLSMAVSTGPCATARSVYFGTNDGRLYYVDKLAKGERSPDRSESAADSVVTTPVELGRRGRLFFVSRDRHLYSYDEGGRGRLSEPLLNVGRVVAGLAVDRDAKTVYVASTNSFLYAVNARTASPTWQVSLGKPLVSTPLLHQGRMFLVTSENVLILLRTDLAASKEPDPVKWRARNVTRILAIGKEYIYVATADHKIASLDPLTGKVVAAAAADDLDFMVSHTGRTLFLGTSGGKVWSLHK